MAKSSQEKLRKGYKLTKLKGEENYYVDAYDGNIVFRKNLNKVSVKIFIPFGPDKIKKAKDYVAKELLARSNKTVSEKLADEGITNPSIKEMYDECVNARKKMKSKATITNYDVSWEHGLEKFWGNKTVSELTQVNIIKFQDWYIENKSDRTFFNTRKCLVMLINYLWDNGKLRHEAKRPKVADLDTEVLNYRRKKKKAGRRYTPEETAALLEWAMPGQTRVAILIYRFMGPRKMEVLSSKRSEIDRVNRTYEFYSTKNKKWRSVPIPGVVYDELIQYLDDTEHLKSDYVFPGVTDTSTHVTSQVFDDEWKETKRLAGITGWNIKNAARIHDLRHTFATDTAEEGWPIKVACDILDMSMEEYERTYADHISKDIKVKLMKRTFDRWKK